MNKIGNVSRPRLSLNFGEATAKEERNYNFA